MCKTGGREVGKVGSLVEPVHGFALGSSPCFAKSNRANEGTIEFCCREISVCHCIQDAVDGENEAESTGRGEGLSSKERYLGESGVARPARGLRLV